MKGQSIIELIIALGCLVLVLAGASLGVISGKLSLFNSNQYAVASLLSSEGLEAARAIRDNNWSDLALGEHGLTISQGHWVFSGTSEGISSKLPSGTRIVEVEAAGDDRMIVRSLVSWKNYAGKMFNLESISYLTNWRKEKVVANEASYLSVDVSGVTFSSANRRLQNITLTNTNTSPIVIDKVIVSWSGTGGLIERLRIGTTNVWSRTGPGQPRGRQASGTELDIQDFSMAASRNYSFEATFDTNLRTRIFSIEFIMSDGSRKLVDNIDPP